MERGKLMLKLALSQPQNETGKREIKLPSCKNNIVDVDGEDADAAKTEKSYISSSVVDEEEIWNSNCNINSEFHRQKRLRVQKWLKENYSSTPTIFSSMESLTNGSTPKQLSPIIPYMNEKIQLNENELSVVVDCTAERIPFTDSIRDAQFEENVCTTTKISSKGLNDVPVKLHESPFLNTNRYKKTICKFCDDYVISRHFSRHLERRHVNEIAVKEILEKPKNGFERKKLLALLRNEGNLDSALRGEVIPKRREENQNTSAYEICSYCKAFFKRRCLNRHSKKCFWNLNTEQESALSKSQLFITSQGTYGEFLSKLNVKDQVFSIMRNDIISKTAQKDPLICLYGENLLKKHRRQQMAVVISNKVRECGRFLIEMRKLGKFDNLLVTLKPLHFDMVIASVKMMSGYQEDKKAFKAPSLAMHFGTTLKQISDLAIKLVLRNNKILIVNNVEQTLTDLGRFKELVITQWTIELSSLAMKDLTEKSSLKPGLLPVTEDILKLKRYTFKEAEKAFGELKKRTSIEFYKILCETTLVLVIIHNRKRVGDIQYLELDSYRSQIKLPYCEQSEFASALSESEKILTQHYKRIKTIGKGSRSVTVLIPKELHKYFELILNIRENSVIVSKRNKYLFAYPNSDRWINGCSVIRKYAKLSGAKNPELITSSRLRKHIATVTQLLNLKHNEIDQLAKFMGHTKNTHESFYKLPQDIYQVAKVSKILQLMEQGKTVDFQNKSLEDIDIDINEAVEDTELSDSVDEPNEVVNPIKLTSKTNNSPLSENSQKSDDTTTKSKKIHRQKWSKEEKDLLQKHFAKFIQKKKAPRKNDVEEIMKKYPSVFYKRNWITIKAYIYNCYRARL